MCVCIFLFYSLKILYLHTMHLEHFHPSSFQLSPNPSCLHPNFMFLFIYSFIYPIESNQCWQIYAYIRSHSSFLCNRSMVKPILTLFPHHQSSKAGGMLTALISCQYGAGNHSCYEFTDAAAQSCPQSSLPQASPPSSSYHHLAPSSVRFSEPWGGEFVTIDVSFVAEKITDLCSLPFDLL